MSAYAYILFKICHGSVCKIFMKTHAFKKKKPTTLLHWKFRRQKVICVSNVTSRK